MYLLLSEVPSGYHAAIILLILNENIIMKPYLHDFKMFICEPTARFAKS